MESIRIIALLGLLNFGYQIIDDYLKLKRKGVSVSTNKHKFKSILQNILLLFFFLLFLGEMIIHTFHLSISLLPSILSKTVHNTIFIALPGIIILVISVVLLHLTLAAFSHSLRFGLHSKNLGKLITDGIFAYTRNPFFISIELLLISIALVFSSPFFIGIAILSVISIHFFILKEERFMQKNYGEEYYVYTKKVGRYF